MRLCALGISRDLFASALPHFRPWLRYRCRASGMPIKRANPVNYWPLAMVDGRAWALLRCPIYKGQAFLPFSGLGAHWRQRRMRLFWLANRLSKTLEIGTMARQQ